MSGYEKSDYWAQKAAKEGYPARSVYKLMEIEEKFHIIPKDGAVLDLGASPGSWTSFLLKFDAAHSGNLHDGQALPSSGEKLSGNCRIVACDLNPLSKTVKGDNLIFIQGDLNEKTTRENIVAAGPYNAVLCDAAPLTTGNKMVDRARSEQLVEMAIWYAENALKTGGGFAVKIFQNGSQKQFLDKMRLLFSDARGFKPKACRSQSVETYLIGLKKR